MAQKTNDTELSMAKFLISDELFQEHFSQCQDVFFLKAGDKGGCMPSLLAISMGRDDTEEHSLFALAIDNFNDYDTRSEALTQIGRHLAEQDKQLMMAFMVSEAWVSHQPDNGTPPTAPRDDPNRQECCILMGQTIDGRFGYAADTFIRDENKTIVAVKPYMRKLCLHSIQDHDEKERTEYRQALLTHLMLEYLIVVHDKNTARRANA